MYLRSSSKDVVNDFHGSFVGGIITMTWYLHSFEGSTLCTWSFCGVFAFFGGCLGFGAGLVLGLVVSLKVTLHFAINVVVSVDVSDLDEVDEEPDEELDDEEELSEVRAPLLVALSTDVRVLSRSLGAKSSSVSSWSWLGVVLGSGGSGGVSSR